MGKSKIVILLNLLVCFSFTNTHAEENSIFIDIGKTRYKEYDDINIYRIGIQREFSSWLRNRGIPLSGFFESSLNYWKGTNNNIYGIAFSPVFVAPLCNKCKYRPYIEGGVGVSFISDNIIDNRDMSSSFQFEDRIGFGIKADNVAVYIRYMHYSNSDLVRPNHGIDIFVAGLSCKF